MLPDCYMAVASLSHAGCKLRLESVLAMAKKVLIIEDEPEIRAILAMSLQRVGGYEVVAAADGIEGIEVAARESPDLIILDALMPKLDGYATCRHVKADRKLSHIPVVFLTAKTAPREVERAMRAGAAGCVAKPFDPLTLAEQIAKIADGSGDVRGRATTRHAHKG